MHWTVHILQLKVRNAGRINLASRPGQETSWYGVDGCTYLYVTQSYVEVQPLHYLDANIVRESRTAERQVYKYIRPRWVHIWLT